jgi:hypothetical protein
LIQAVTNEKRLISNLPFFEDFSAAQAFLLQQVNSQLVDNIIFLFLFELMDLWLAETSQQPISQSTWLKVTLPL